MLDLQWFGGDDEARPAGVRGGQKHVEKDETTTDDDNKGGVAFAAPAPGKNYQIELDKTYLNTTDKDSRYYAKDPAYLAAGKHVKEDVSTEGLYNPGAQRQTDDLDFKKIEKSPEMAATESRARDADVIRNEKVLRTGGAAIQRGGSGQATWDQPNADFATEDTKLQDLNRQFEAQRQAWGTGLSQEQTRFKMDVALQEKWKNTLQQIASVFEGLDAQKLQNMLEVAGARDKGLSNGVTNVKNMITELQSQINPAIMAQMTNAEYQKFYQKLGVLINNWSDTWFRQAMQLNWDISNPNVAQQAIGGIINLINALITKFSGS